MREPDYAAEMKLPDGRTCADCYAVRFCVGIGCTTREATRCDYWPNRFRLPKYSPPTVVQVANARDELARVDYHGDCDPE